MMNKLVDLAARIIGVCFFIGHKFIIAFGTVSLIKLIYDVSWN